ncbi:unnamed protein product [Fraxinus pennsylvanica]|uniref:Yippee domain-containing protein n=1 Tax=Fraxinus pennsylvanica TaxID=56036 RepID=A0AAD2A6D0_9LAMI|nr:unnamed protein product [Fraxinus pennsylvanica]
MGSSVLQFEELNQYPESTSSSSKILPMLELKLETIDERSPYLQPPLTQIYALAFTSFLSSSKMLSPILMVAPLFLSKTRKPNCQISLYQLRKLANTFESFAAPFSVTAAESFNCRTGKAYLFDKVVNVTTGEKEERKMMTGMHTVVDTFCVRCGSLVGWRYIVRDLRFECRRRWRLHSRLLEKICTAISLKVGKLQRYRRCLRSMILLRAISTFFRSVPSCRDCTVADGEL